MNPLIIIPARMASTRLPNKPMALIGGKPMIVQAWLRAKEANIGRVIVACDGVEIAQAIEAEGGEAVVTDADLPSGSDRIWQALHRIDGTEEHEVIVNLQGDMPTLDPQVISHVLSPLANECVDIATLAAKIHNPAEINNPAVVKIALAHSPNDPAGEAKVGRALYFSRAPIPANEGVYYHHIGIYAYRRDALKKFVALPPSALEMREKLEQLRALEAGMRIDVVVVDTVPLGVDTPEQLEQARAVIKAHSA